MTKPGKAAGRRLVNYLILVSIRVMDTLPPAQLLTRAQPAAPLRMQKLIDMTRSVSLDSSRGQH